MDHVGYFNAFLTNTVNLPDGKLRNLGTRVDTIYEALTKADLGTDVLGKKPQGSWAQRTIINPRPDVEFDADFMLELDEQSEWQPYQYNDAVYRALDEHPIYGNMQHPLEAKNRCVRVTYANDMHVDVVPYVDLAIGGEHIINAETNEFEATDPDAFTAWMRRQDDTANGNLRRVIRILKYLRDHRGWFPDTVSIILTTVVGNTIDPNKVHAQPDYYGNVPKTLLHVVENLAAWTKANAVRPNIDDPSGSGASFTHRWTQAMYEQFSADIQTLADDIRNAYEEQDRAESVRRWQDILGLEFKAPDGSDATKFPPVGGDTAVGDDTTTTSRSGRAG
jgi:hypothetical protein